MSDEHSPWLRPPRRSWSSGRTTSPTASTRPSSSAHSPKDYKLLLSLLISTIPPTSAKWTLLTKEWWDRLDDEQRAQVTTWAEEVWGLANCKTHGEPEIPRYLITARDLASAAAARNKASKYVAAMKSINQKARVKHDEHYTSARSLGKESHEYRAIGHRAAMHYGTTRAEWMAGTSWQ